MDKTTKSNPETRDFEIVDGELLEVVSGTEIEASDPKKPAASSAAKIQSPPTEVGRSKPANQSSNKSNAVAAQKTYLFLPFLFLTVALLGGLRFADPTNDFLFLKPALICLIFAAILLVLFFRARLIQIDGWFAEDFAATKTAANAAVLLALFAATVQVFNALLPERGLPFWTVAFCFFWTLWNNLFAEFETKKLLKSLGALFGLAFVVKYLLLANLTAPASDDWLQAVWENPARETFTWILDLPRFSAATGYVQFFTLIFYLIGLFLLPSKSSAKI